MSGWFLGFALFFPRITLAVCWLGSMMPANNTDFLIDVLAWLIAPRLLIAWWLYEADAHPLLIALFVFVEIFASGGTSSGARAAHRTRNS